MEIRRSTTSITHHLVVSNFRNGGEDVELRGNGNYWERLYGDDWSEFDLTSQERSMIIHYLLGKEFGLLRSTQRSIGDKQ